MSRHTHAHVLNIHYHTTGLKCLQCLTMSISFSVDSLIRGHHIYKHIWTPNLGEINLCRVEPGNIHDPYAVAVKRDQDDTTIGHVPGSISIMKLGGTSEESCPSGSGRALPDEFRSRARYVTSTFLKN